MSYATLAAYAAASLVGATTVALTVEELVGAHEKYATVAAQVQEQHDAQLVEAAVIMYQFNTGNGDVPSVERLVELGYIKQEFLARKKVEVPAEGKTG